MYNEYSAHRNIDNIPTLSAALVAFIQTRTSGETLSRGRCAACRWLLPVGHLETQVSSRLWLCLPQSHGFCVQVKRGRGHGGGTPGPPKGETCVPQPHDSRGGHRPGWTTRRCCPAALP
ncbi:hypothetical protein CK820_G0043208 [Pan troglodytes]|uniref:Uncharacterized protein n=1 Tax=Pan troglodytes TaxID=9598 RepID=A0A2J8JY91_PANTR|nr:hypothetical protein CK820_G0043208 [Pan troglodytes]